MSSEQTTFGPIAFRMGRNVLQDIASHERMKMACKCSHAVFIPIPNQLSHAIRWVKVGQYISQKNRLLPNTSFYHL